MTRYTDEQRAEALALYIDHGAAQTSRQLDIPARTIRRWANDAGLAAARDKTLTEATAKLQANAERMRAEVRVRLMEIVLDAFDRMTQEHVDYRGKDAVRVTWEQAPSGDMKNYMTTAAIALDKYRLEMGESTDRVEQAGSLSISVNGVDPADVK